jgi:hypothetical protein
LAADILSEIGVISLARSGSRLTVSPVAVSGKMDITLSPTYKKFGKESRL